MKSIVSAQLIKVDSRSDRTWKLVFNTQELSGEIISKLSNELMNQVWLVIASDGETLTEADMPGRNGDSNSDW